jgi:hypothetical protein
MQSISSMRTGRRQCTAPAIEPPQFRRERTAVLPDEPAKIDAPAARPISRGEVGGRPYTGARRQQPHRSQRRLLHPGGGVHPRNWKDHRHLAGHHVKRMLDERFHDVCAIERRIAHDVVASNIRLEEVLNDAAGVAAIDDVGRGRHQPGAPGRFRDAPPAATRIVDRADEILARE